MQTHGLRVALTLGALFGLTTAGAARVVPVAGGGQEASGDAGVVLTLGDGPRRPRVDGTVHEPGGDGLGILAGRPRIRPTRVDTPPVIDGRLDDPVWRTSTLITDFVQQSPLDGTPATEYTEVYLAYDRDHLYFGFYLHYDAPGVMRANRVDRDLASEDDLVTVYFDPFMDQQRIYELDINAYNVQGDGVINASDQLGNGAIPVADRSWDALFYSGAQIVDDGYTAEMAIPFKSVRYPQRPPGVAHRWGFQIVREIKGKNQENDVWAPMSREVQSFMAQMGVLEGMTDLSTSRNLELLPTFTAIRFEEFDAASGLSARTTLPEAGLNLKYGLTSNLTADLAINPDFSQIESDQPQIAVNQRFPLFFDELRPFFLEGAEIFQFTSPIQLVHTRTIIAPRVGGKLTGKVGRTMLGLLVADDEAPGLRDDTRDSAFGETAKFFVGRARYDLYAESHIGTLFTDREFLDGYSRVGGFDTQLRINQVSRFNFVAYQSAHRDEEGVEQTGPMWGALYSRQHVHQLVSGVLTRRTCRLG